MSAKTERKGINLTPRGSITDFTTYARNYDDDLNLTIAIMSRYDPYDSNVTLTNNYGYTSIETKAPEH